MGFDFANGVSIQKDAGGAVTGYTFKNVYAINYNQTSNQNNTGDLLEQANGNPLIFQQDTDLAGTYIGTAAKPHVLRNDMFGQGPKAGSLQIKDDDLTLGGSYENGDQVSVGNFNTAAPGASTVNMPAGSKIAVRGELTMTAQYQNSQGVWVDYATDVKGLVLMTSTRASAKDNFGFATDKDYMQAMADAGHGPNMRFVITGARDLPNGILLTDGIVLCYAADALIETADGPVRAGDLAVGTMVKTRDAGFQPIRWTGSRMVMFGTKADAPLRPILIPAGALGNGLPTQDLRVSPAHSMAVTSDLAEQLVGRAETLIKASDLVGHNGIRVDGEAVGIEYVHFMFDDHQIVYANGAPAESLYSGPNSVRAAGDAAVAEIYELFPELKAEHEAGVRREPVRPFSWGENVGHILQHARSESLPIAQAH